MHFIFVPYMWRHLFTPLRVGWPPTPQVYFGPWEGLSCCSTMLPIGASQAKQFSLFFPVEASQARIFTFPPPWSLPKLGNFHFSPRGLPKLRLFTSPPLGAPQAREFSLFPPVGASQAREFSLFPAVTASQAMEFSLFPPLEALQAAECQIARQRRLVPQIPCSLKGFPCFCNGFLQISTVLYTFVAINVRQCIQFPYLPNRWKYRYLQCFLQFFHVPMPVANSNIYIYIRNPSKTLFLTVFFQCFQSNRR